VFERLLEDVRGHSVKHQLGAAEHSRVDPLPREVDEAGAGAAVHVGPPEVASFDLDVEYPTARAAVCGLFVHDLRSTLDTDRHAREHRAALTDHLE
jgi:hypothetical protein